MQPIPLFSSVPFKVGTEIKIVANGDNIDLIKENTTDILIYSKDGSNNPREGDYWGIRGLSVATLLNVDKNVWYLSGESTFDYD